MDYLRYLLPTVVLTLTGLGILAGGLWVWTGLGLFVLMAIPDMPMDFDFSTRRMSAKGAMFMLFIQVIPLTFLWIAYWLFTRTHPAMFEIIGAVTSMAIITAAVGLPIGHEMFHRSEGISRALGAAFTNLFMFNYIELEHNKSHHVETSSALDVDTPYRGESVYHFIPRLFLYVHTNSFAQEARRMKGYGKSVWFSLSSRVFWQWFGALALLGVFYLADGWRSAAIAAVTALVGGSIVTIFSYVQHYGLQRVPGSPIEKHHAFNHTRPISRMLTFEIVTHSQHHTDPTVPYYKLTAYRDVPLVGSAIAYFFLTLVPPLWHRVTKKHLACWDATFASPAERQLAAEANQRAGWSS